MKAKEYIARLQEGPITSKEAEKLLIDFLDEGTALGEQRGSSDAVMLGIFREMDLKWRAVARKVPEIKPDGYREFLVSKIPNLKNSLGW